MITYATVNVNGLSLNSYKKIIPESDKLVWFENAVIRLNAAEQHSWKKDIIISKSDKAVSAKIYLEKYPNVSFTIAPTKLNQLGLSLSMSMKLPQRFNIIQMQDIIAVVNEIQKITESTCMQFKA